MSDDDKTSLMIFLETEKKNMQNKKNQSSVGMMIQRCHKWRQKRTAIPGQTGKRETGHGTRKERCPRLSNHINSLPL